MLTGSGLEAEATRNVSLVSSHITAVPVTGTERGIDYGCPFGGCVYDLNGMPNSVAVAPFPFPGFRAYSLVLSVGTQMIQGGMDVRFTTTASGPLTICLNDNTPTDNRGGYVLNISVDELGPPTPP